MKNSEGIPFVRPTKLVGNDEGNEKEGGFTMSVITVRFRGICCFIEPTNGESKIFRKRVVLPNGSKHEHAGMEKHFPIIEFYADDLQRKPAGMELVNFTRPGDEAQYQYIEITEPVRIELIGTKEGIVAPGLNLEDSVIHLDSLVSGRLRLKQTLLGDAVAVDSSLAQAVIDLPKGVLMSGPPEAAITAFPKSPKFTKRRVGRWLEHIAEVKGDFGLQLTPLGKPNATPKQIWFKSSTRLITIANEPLRLIVGQFVPTKASVAASVALHGHGKTKAKGGAKKKKVAKNGNDVHQGMQSANGGSPQSTAHFNLYWDLMADPPASRPLPEPVQGSGPSCSPAIKP
jgi:hypothetical protein